MKLLNCNSKKLQGTKYGTSIERVGGLVSIVYGDISNSKNDVP